MTNFMYDKIHKEAIYGYIIYVCIMFSKSYKNNVEETKDEGR